MDYIKSEVNEKLVWQDDSKKVVIVKQENGSSNAPVLSFVDILLSIFVVSPLVVSAWRGAWGLMDLYPEYFPLFPSFVAGMVIHVILAICQDSLHNAVIEADKHWSLKIVSHFLRRFYTYIFLQVTILHWRGGWGLLDYYLNVKFNDNNLVASSEGSHWMILMWIACFITLICMRTLRSATAPPFAICLDKGDYVFRFPTMFENKTRDNITLYMLDCLFSVAVLGNLVVAFWRGLWVVVDILLIPSDYIWSIWVSLILGLLMIGLVFRLQPCMKKLCVKTTGITKVIIADFYIVLSIVSTIFFWRGVWTLFIVYLLPDDPVQSCIVTHCFGFMALVVLGSSNSLLVRGIYKDGKGQNGECVVFPCEYLQVIFEQENPCDDLDYRKVSNDFKSNSVINGDSKV